MNNLFTSVVMLNATLRHSFQNNSIEELTRKEADGVLYTTYGNLGKRRSTELNLFINFNLGLKTRLTLSVSLRLGNLKPKQRVAKAGNDDLIDRRDQNSEMNSMMMQGN